MLLGNTILSNTVGMKRSSPNTTRSVGHDKKLMSLIRHMFITVKPTIKVTQNARDWNYVPCKALLMPVPVMRQNLPMLIEMSR